MYYMKPAKGGIHEGALKKALMDWVEAIEMTSSTFAGLTGGPVKFDMPLEVRTANFKTIFSYIVMVLVEAELSYDKSIGTSQDRELIMETIDREFQK